MFILKFANKAGVCPALFILAAATVLLCSNNEKTPRLVPAHKYIHSVLCVGFVYGYRAAGER